MNNKKRLVVGLLTVACIFSMTICSVYGAATSRKYVTAVNGQYWRDLTIPGSNTLASIKKVRNGNVARGRYGVNVGMSNGRVVVLQTQMHNPGHATIGSCSVKSNTYSWAINDGIAGQTYHLSGKRQYKYDSTLVFTGWWQADEN